MPGLDDFTDRLSNHDLADVDALHVAFRIAHAPAHVRVEREPQVPDQHLAVAALGQRTALDAEIVFAHRALRAARQHDAPVFHLQRSEAREVDRKSTRLNSSHVRISYAVFCLKKKKKQQSLTRPLDSKSTVTLNVSRTSQRGSTD